MEGDNINAILYSKLGHYYLTELIDDGATSFIYKATQTKEGPPTKIFAIKIFEYQNFNVFSNEISIHQQISFPNIMQCLAFGEGVLKLNHRVRPSLELIRLVNKKVKFIIFDYFSNGDLFNYVSMPKMGFPEEVSRTIFIDILNAVEHCHSRGIVHNDIKPENVLLSENFRAVLIDLGFAQRTVANNPIIFNWRGTKCYGGPDVINSSSTGYDGYKNDVFSLGVLLYVITVGIFPFNSPTFKDLNYKNIIREDNDAFWKNNAANVTLSDEFKDLFIKMVNFDQERRISIEEIKEHPWVKRASSLELIDETYLKEFAYRKIIVDTIKKANYN